MLEKSESGRKGNTKERKKDEQGKMQREDKREIQAIGKKVIKK